MAALAVVAALGLAAALGAGDAPNATATLTALRVGSPRRVAALSFASHLAGGLLGGTAVAVTITSMLELPADDLAEAYTAASVAAVAFMAFCARGGVPASASYGLVGGLVGAGAAVGGWDAVQWGGIDGVRPVGVLGALAGLVVSPLAGVAVAAAARWALTSGLRRATQSARPATDVALWASAAAVGFAGGSNDGQKAMGLVVGVLVAEGSLGPGDGVPLAVRLAVALVLAAATVVAGRRLVSTVGRGLYRVRAVEGLAAQSASAVVILASGVVGAPVSTSNVVTSSVIGVGADHRPRHVRWTRVLELGGAWVLSVPVCALVAAALAVGLRAT